MKSASDPETDTCPCPKCGADSFRMISNTSFLLKGGGWFHSSYPGTDGKQTSQPGTRQDSGSKENNTAKTETKQ